MQNFFARSFNLHNPSPQVLFQITLSTSLAGMGILPLTDIAPAAYIASLRNLISEFVARNPGGVSPEAFLQTRSFEDMVRYNWDRYHSLTDNQGQQTLWDNHLFL